ncbi:MAG: FAD-binding protein, partial [Acidobacteriota bacterium]|nr:FAD-binding protein [Acidobacteriota bacterium]
MHDVIIIGAGPAGLSAAMWCDELGLDALVLERGAETGGQLLRVYNAVENHLGVVAPDGRALRDVFAAQVEGCDFDLWTEAEIESVDLRARQVSLRSGERLRAVSL